MNRIKRNQSALIGALVADAAALGLHWLYDVECLAREASDTPEYRTPDADVYTDADGYFAHGGKSAGENSQYGTVLKIMLLCLHWSNGALNERNFQHRYQQWFGYGGLWQGYIDHPTRDTLTNIMHGTISPSGADDEQLPALATVPAVVARVRNPTELLSLIDRAVRLTNNNDLAVEVAQHAAVILYDLLEGSTPQQALGRAGILPETIGEIYAQLIDSSGDPALMGGIAGRACNLDQGYPLLLGLLHHTHTFTDAVRANILAGGDSCGRAITLGALAGAYYGIGGNKGIPLDWIARLKQTDGVFAAIDFLSQPPD